MRNGITKRIGAAIAVGSLGLTASVASAGPIYEFIDTNGISLAEIELQTIPAGFADIVSYRLTASGDALFNLGLGAITFGGFSGFWGTSILDDGHGGLMGSAAYDNGGEVLSSLVNGPEDFYTGFYGIGTDFMRSSTQVFATVARGNYLLKATSVSEPSSWALFSLGAFCFFVVRRFAGIKNQVSDHSMQSN